MKTTDEFLQALPEKNIPASTHKVQQWACNTFHLWRKSRNKFIRDNAQQRIQRQLIAETPLENMTNAEINESWPSFILEAGKIHGEPYPPSILHLLIMGLQGFLHLKGNHLTVLHDTIFKHLKDALHYRMKILTGENLGHKEQAQTVSVDIEEQMWQKGVLGVSNPSSLLHTFKYLIGTLYTLRASVHKSLNIDEQLQVLE